MRLFRDLNESDRQHHLAVAGQMSPGNVYFFDPPVWAVPNERRLKGSPDEGVPILFTYAQFVRFRCRPSIFQDCVFSVQAGQEPYTGRFEFTVSLLFTREMTAPQPI